MLRLYTEFSLKNTVCNTQFLWNTIIYIKKNVFFFVLFICRFLKSEMSLNFFSLTSEIFVKTQNFDSYDVIMT